MRLSVERDHLLTALERVARIAKPGPQPAFEVVALRADAEALHLEALNYGIEVRVACRAAVIEAGTATVPAEAIRKLVKRLPDDTIDIRIAENGRVHVACGRSRVHFPSLPTDRLPSLGEQDEACCFAMPGAALARLLSVSFAAPENLSQGYLCGVCLHVDAERRHLCAGATDTKVLARARVCLPDGAEAMPRIIVGNGAVEEIGRLARDVGEERLTIATSRRMVVVEASSVRIRSRLVDGAYPDYERAFPLGEVPRCAFDARAARDALARVVAATGNKATAVRCAVADGSLTITTSDGNGTDVLETLESVGGAGASINLSAGRASAIVDALDGDRVEVAMHAFPAGAVWRSVGDDSLLCYLMPMLG